jgi:hypothetical protein
MRLVFTVFEIISSLILLLLGMWTFHSGFAESTGASMIKLPVGAALIFGGGFALYASTLCRLRHRRRERGVSMQSAK